MRFEVWVVTSVIWRRHVGVNVESGGPHSNDVGCMYMMRMIMMMMRMIMMMMIETCGHTEHLSVWRLSRGGHLRHER